MHCPLQIFVIFFNLNVAIASLLLISGVVFPFASILAPRYSKLLTLSISSPSIFTMASSLHLSVSMILVFLTLRFRPFNSLCSFTDFVRFSSPLAVVDRSAVSLAYLKSLIGRPCIIGSSYTLHCYKDHICWQECTAEKIRPSSWPTFAICLSKDSLNRCGTRLGRLI